MGHYAKVQDGLVTQVIVAEQDYINTLPDKGLWIQTSYNTRGAVHFGPDGLPDQGFPLRKNFAGIGYAYDVVRDAFIPPKPYASWVLDAQSCLWAAPVAMPKDGKVYVWDEPAQVWLLMGRAKEA